MTDFLIKFAVGFLAAFATYCFTRAYVEWRRTLRARRKIQDKLDEVRVSYSAKALDPRIVERLQAGQEPARLDRDTSYYPVQWGPLCEDQQPEPPLKPGDTVWFAGQECRVLPIGTLTDGRNTKGQFVKGRSGNPKGRPKRST